MISTKNENNKKVAIEFDGPAMQKLMSPLVSIHWDDWPCAIC